MDTPQGQPGRHAVLHLTNQPGQVQQAESAVVQSLEALHYPKASVFAVRLALHEAIANAFRHGHRNLPPTTPVLVEFDCSPSRVEIIVADQGPGFDPDSVPDPTAEENIERGSGRGLLLIRSYMAEVEYTPPGNRLRMVYARPASA